MAKLAAIFYTFVGATLVLFAVMVYLMTNVNPPRLQEADTTTVVTTTTVETTTTTPPESADDPVMLLGLTYAMPNYMSTSESNSERNDMSVSKDSENNVTEVKKAKGRRSIKTIHQHRQNNPSIVVMQVVDKEHKPRIEILFYPKRSNKWNMYKKHNVLGPDHREMSSIIKIMPDDSILLERKLISSTQDIRTSTTKLWYTPETTKTSDEIFDMRKDGSNSVHSEIESITEAGHLATRTPSSQVSDNIDGNTPQGMNISKEVPLDSFKIVTLQNIDNVLHSTVPNLNKASWEKANVLEDEMNMSEDITNNEEPRSNLTENLYINQDVTNTNMLYTEIDTSSIKDSLVNLEINSSEGTEDVHAVSNLKFNKKKSITKMDNDDSTRTQDSEKANICKNEIKAREDITNTTEIVNITESVTETDTMYTGKGMSPASRSSVHEGMNSSDETQTQSYGEVFEIDSDINDSKIKSITLVNHVATRTPPTPSEALQVNSDMDMTKNISKEALSESYEEIEIQDTDNLLLSKTVTNNESLSTTRIVNMNKTVINTDIPYTIKGTSFAKISTINVETNGNTESQTQSYKNFVENTNDTLLSPTEDIDKMKTSTEDGVVTHTTINIESTDILPTTKNISYINGSNANFNTDMKMNLTVDVETEANDNISNYSVTEQRVWLKRTEEIDSTSEHLTSVEMKQTIPEIY